MSFRCIPLSDNKSSHVCSSYSSAIISYKLLFVYYILYYPDRLSTIKIEYNLSKYARDIVHDKGYFCGNRIFLAQSFKSVEDSKKLDERIDRGPTIRAIDEMIEFFETIDSLKECLIIATQQAESRCKFFPYECFCLSFVFCLLK